MPAERLSMRQIRDVLRLCFAAKLPQRAIARSLSLSQGAISRYLSRARAAGITWPLPEDLEDEQLEALLFPPPSGTPADQRPMPDWAWVHRELRRPDVTLALLWEEYRAAAGRHGLPVNFLCWGRLDDGAEVVRRNPDTIIVIDHLGLLQPNEPPPLADPWADLLKLLALAAYPNVRVKISGACTLSRKPFPYNDIWDPVLRIIDAFGIDRCMWGTDWTRTSGMLTYEQGVAPFRNTARLSDSDKSKLMGGTLRKVYGW